jgi:hypothetical protein
MALAPKKKLAALVAVDAAVAHAERKTIRVALRLAPSRDALYRDAAKRSRMQFSAWMIQQLDKGV